MTNLKEQTIGVEIEFTGTSRKKAAETVAKYFGTAATHNGGVYDSWAVKDNTGREWKILSDSSLKAEKKIGGEIRIADSQYRCELVTPILRWSDIETLQEIVRKIRKSGGFVNETCGLHVHIGAADISAQAVRNLINTVASREELFYKALNVHENRKRYCKPTDKNFLRDLNAKKPATLEEVKEIWYKGEDHTNFHYHSSRYTICNLHALFSKGTIEFRIFNGTLHAGEIKTAMQFSAALVAFAKKAKRAIYRPINLENEKFAMRTFLTRPTGLNLNSEEFATLRFHLTKHLEGNAAWRYAC